MTKTKRSTKRENYEAYLAANLNHLTDQWVVFCDCELVCNHQNLKKAVEKARTIVGDGKLFLAKVPDNEMYLYRDDLTDEDVEFIEGTRQAWKEIDEGKGTTMTLEEFRKEMASWQRRPRPQR